MPKDISFIACDALQKEAKIILFGAPFQGTVSHRHGTDKAPHAIRNESHALESYSPYLNKDLVQSRIRDVGNLSLDNNDVTTTLSTIEAFVTACVQQDKIPFMIGGEHLVTLPAVKALHRTYKELVVLQFDAHTDLRDTYEGASLSHATVMKRVHETINNNKIYQFGIRSGLKKEFEYADLHLHIERFTVKSLKEIIPQIKNKPVYISIDLDVLDPSYLPGTGTPEPGGITFQTLMDAVHSLKSLNIVGADVVELAPELDTSSVSTAVAAKIIRELLLVMT